MERRGEINSFEYSCKLIDLCINLHYIFMQTRSQGKPTSFQEIFKYRGIDKPNLDNNLKTTGRLCTHILAGAIF